VSSGPRIFERINESARRSVLESSISGEPPEAPDAEPL
jgi:hypothetical protein